MVNLPHVPKPTDVQRRCEAALGRLGARTMVKCSYCDQLCIEMLLVTTFNVVHTFCSTDCAMSLGGFLSDPLLRAKVIR